MIILFATQYKN